MLQVSITPAVILTVEYKHELSLRSGLKKVTKSFNLPTKRLKLAVYWKSTKIQLQTSPDSNHEPIYISGGSGVYNTPLVYSIFCYLPIPWALTVYGLRLLTSTLWLSICISITLLIRAQSGARGKPTTNIVTKPYCITIK